MTTGGHGSSPRRKLDLDLGAAPLRDRVGEEQVEYYRRRAPWFDDCYTCSGDYDRGPEANARWRQDMAHIEAALAAADLRGHCVELGAGTGHWTERIAPLVDGVTAIDAAPEMLEIARTRFESSPARVDFELADLWHWEPADQWDSAAALFFLEHVPNEVLPELLARLHRALRPGAPLFVAEGAWYDIEPAVETRDIGGQEFRVVERRRAPEEFEAVFDEAGFSVEIGRVERFIDLVATRR